MRYYVYRHIRTDLDCPMYIGVGTKRKGFTYKSEYFRANDFDRRSVFWKNIQKKCINGIVVDILFESDLINEAHKKEIEFISMYGRNDLGLGPLVNLTDGGEGISGSIRSLDYREKQRKAKIGKKQSVESILKRVNSRKGYKHSEETKLKMSQKAMGNTRSIGAKRTEEQKNKLSVDRKGKWGVGVKQSELTIQKRIKSFSKNRKVDTETKPK